MMMSGNSHMDMGMEIVHVVRNVHEYIDVCQGFFLYSNFSPLEVIFGNPLPFFSSLSKVMDMFEGEDNH